MPATKKTATRKSETQSELFSLLKKDHKIVLDLFKQIEEERSDDTFEMIKEELAVHMRGEEEYFYPLLKDDESMESKRLEAIEEHNVGRSIIELINDETDDKVWLARVKVLKDIIEHHIEEEEEELFPEASKKIDREELDDAAEKIKEQKDDKEDQD